MTDLATCFGIDLLREECPDKYWPRNLLDRIMSDAVASVDNATVKRCARGFFDVRANLLAQARAAGRDFSDTHELEAVPSLDPIDHWSTPERL